MVSIQEGTRVQGGEDFLKYSLRERDRGGKVNGLIEDQTRKFGVETVEKSPLGKGRTNPTG